MLMMTSWKGTFSALLAIFAGNSQVPGEFPAERPVTWSFDVFYDMRPNKRLSKRSRGWWFETPSHPLWRHSNVSLPQSMTEHFTSSYGCIITGDPLHSRALAHSRAPLFTQPCPHCPHSRAPGEQWAPLCVFTLQGCVQAARLCRGSPVIIKFCMNKSSQVKSSQRYFIQVNTQSYHTTLDRLKPIWAYLSHCVMTFTQDMWLPLHWPA